MKHNLGTEGCGNNLQELFHLELGLGLSMDRVAEAYSRPRILLIEDDQDIANLVQLHLNDLNVDFKHCARGDEGLETATADDWNLIILDLCLPGIGGFEICRNLREHGNYTPILMLSAKLTELDQVLGLELGADDYVTKPFSPMALIARVKAVLRRVSHFEYPPQKDEVTGLVKRGALSIDIKKHRVAIDDRDIELTAKEFDLLLFFARHPGQVFRRSELLDKVWGYGHEGYNHTVNSHINRLRSKIEENPADPEQIITVWGVGYKLEATVRV